MRRCLELAARGIGTAAPNPMVGAVLVHQGRLIGEGWHKACGQAHAEIDCLHSVAEHDKPLIADSTMYVSLEPCAHYGKTPPCASRIVAEGIKKVVICNNDPFEKVRGRGIDILLNAGIEVVTGVLEKDGRWLNRRFFHYHEEKRPYIVLKWAESADGFIAPANRSRKQISGLQSQLLLHKWRTEEQAIMIGTTTALNDNPALTARSWKGRQPIRIIPDANLILPATHNIYKADASTIIFTHNKEEQHENIHLKKVSNVRDLKEILDVLTEMSINSILVEGGAMLLNSFIDAGLWEEARIFTAPHALGEGIPSPVLKRATMHSCATIGIDQLTTYIHNRMTPD